MPCAMLTFPCCWLIEMPDANFSFPRLILVRHGESESNAANVFTGWADPPLTEKGEEEARLVGRLLRGKGIRIERAFTSALQRGSRSLQLMLDVLGQRDVETSADRALNERDYGILTGLNKSAAASKWGEDQVRRWRRSYAEAPPGGESLRDTTARVLAYYVTTILPAIMAGGTTLIVAHGNSLRALIMTLDGMTPEAIECFELSTGATHLFTLAPDTSITGHEILR